MKETLRDQPPGPRDPSSSTTTTTTTATSGLAAPLKHNIDPSMTGNKTSFTTQDALPLTGTTAGDNGTSSSGVPGSSGSGSGVAGFDRAPLASEAKGTESTLPSGHGTGHSEATQSVVDRLNANVQASVYESTGRRDVDVAQEQPASSTGKRILEGLGLGGSERKTTLDGTDDV